MVRGPKAVPRRGTISRNLKTALVAEALQLAEADDPVAVITRVGEFYAGLEDELEVIASIRLDAVRELRRRGWAYQRIADATGLSKPRVQQLATSAGVGGHLRRPAADNEG